jgi:hypothetical protein
MKKEENSALETAIKSRDCQTKVYFSGHQKQLCLDYKFPRDLQPASYLWNDTYSCQSNQISTETLVSSFVMGKNQFIHVVCTNKTDSRGPAKTAIAVG